MLEGFGTKSFNKLIDNIEKSKSVKLSSFISAMGISGVGQSSGKTISQCPNHSFDELVQALDSDFNFTKLDDFGDAINNNIYEWYSQEDNRDEFKAIAELLDFIVEENSLDDILKCKTFVITGTMQSMKRNDIKSLIENLGGKVSGSVSKKTDALVYGESEGSKLDKAKELGVLLMTEQEFRNVGI